MSAIIIDSSVKIENLPTSSHFTEDGEIVVYRRQFEEIDYDDVERDINNLIEYAKREKISLKGKIIIKHGKVFKQLMFGKKGVRENEVEIKINVKKLNTKPKSPKLTLEEKFELLSEYVKSNHKIPSNNTIYKEFKLGLFVKQLKESKINVEHFNKIVENYSH